MEMNAIKSDGVTVGDEAATAAVTCPHSKEMRSRSRAVTRAARDTSRPVTDHVTGNVTGLEGTASLLSREGKARNLKRPSPFSDRASFAQFHQASEALPHRSSRPQQCSICQPPCCPLVDAY
jgi:hypothetical protein